MCVEVYDEYWLYLGRYGSTDSAKNKRGVELLVGGSGVGYIIIISFLLPMPSKLVTVDDCETLPT